MTVKEKLKQYLQEKKLTHTSIAKAYGTKPQTISKMLSEKGNVTLDFVVWFSTNYPDVDMNKLIVPGRVRNIIREESTPYGEGRPINKEKILEEIGKILDQYIK